MRTMVDVVATGQGWDGIAMREPGEQFQMPEGATGSWFHPVGEAPPPPKPVAKSAHKGRKAHADPPGGDQA